MSLALNAQTPIGDPDEPEWDDDDSDEEDVEEEEEDEDPMQLARRAFCRSRVVWSPPWGVLVLHGTLN